MRRHPPAPVCRMFLCRHAATAQNEIRPFILQGSELDGPLTTTGETQAAQLAEALRHFDIAALYASPMQRAWQTAGIVAAHHGLSVTTVPEFRECGVGLWKGLDWQTIQARYPGEYAAFRENPVEVPHPEGESYGDVYRRATPALEAILTHHPGQNIVVIAHCMVNRILLAGHAGIPLQAARSIKQHNCGINVLQHNGEQIELLTLNSVLHLDE